MPNIILTKKCNKNCSYCFASKDNDEMSLSTFSSILDKIKSKHIQLLGGEPTLHSQFDEVLRLAYNKEEIESITLISNFLFSDDILNTLISFINKNPKKIGFLINSTDLDIGNRMEVFKKNYNKIYEVMYSHNRELNVVCGITIDENKTYEYYLQYIDYLIENIVIERMRISLRFPGDDKDNFYFINNTKLGDTIVFITKKLLNENIAPNIDCIHFECMYSSKEEFKFLTKFLKGSNKTMCNMCPSDFLPNGESIHCYPCSNIKVNYSDFDSDVKIKESLLSLYKEKEKNIKLPNTCLTCKRYINKKCAGPCLGFFSKID